MYHSGTTKELKDDLSYQPPKVQREDPSLLPREVPIHSPTVVPKEERGPNVLAREPSHSVMLPSELETTPTPAPPTETPTVPPAPSPRCPTRASRNKGVDRLSPSFGGKSYTTKLAQLIPMTMLASVVGAQSGISPISVHMMKAQAMGMDSLTNLQEEFPPGLLQSPFAFKAKASRDPDLPTLTESITGPNAKQFWTAMDAEIASLESKGTWTVVDRSSVPSNVKVIPGAFCQRVKRLPSGLLSKFKSRWCCRGDLQKNEMEGSNYSPLVGWPTVRTALTLAATHGWKSRQVDFTLAFCQSPQPVDKPLYMELPKFYRPTGMDGRDVVLKLNKSIYGQVDSPKLFYEHLSKGMDKLGFKPSTSDPCLFIHQKHKLMVLNYCDDQIWLSPDNALTS